MYKYQHHLDKGAESTAADGASIAQDLDGDRQDGAEIPAKEPAEGDNEQSQTMPTTAERDDGQPLKVNGETAPFPPEITVTEDAGPEETQNIEIKQPTLVVE